MAEAPITEPLAVAVEQAARRLREDARLTELFGGTPAVFDAAPNGQAHPFIVIGEVEGLPERAEGYDGTDVVMTVHVWDRPEPPNLGKRRVLAIARAAREALLDLTISLPFHRLVDAEPEDLEQAMNDPTDGGLTKHAVVAVRWLTEPI